MKTYKCTWNVNAGAEEWPLNIPKYLPELIIEAPDEAHALYQYRVWLKERLLNP